MFGRVFSAVTNVAQRISTISGINTASSVTAVSSQISGGAWSLVPVRSKIRCYFPRPSETKRINKHGWLKRLSTIGGRRVLMRRILKGKHVLSH